ncbi:UNVERIFIED_CONTAM: hypothetical protein HHA_454940 [Hammondia hammondi]|eukprot:XP_008888644.1 hypothetical protein HHA_454940 [Hammondia hammondi]
MFILIAASKDRAKESEDLPQRRDSDGFFANDTFSGTFLTFKAVFSRQLQNIQRQPLHKPPPHHKFFHLCICMWKSVERLVICKLLGEQTKPTVQSGRVYSS